MATEDPIYNVKVFDKDDRLILESPIDLTTTILKLKISLHTQSLLNIQPSDQIQILFNDRVLSNSTTFQQIYNLNNRDKCIKLQAIQSEKHWFSGMNDIILSKHAFSGDVTRISYDSEFSQHSNENVEMSTVSQPKRKYSHSPGTSVDENTTNSPFFARRGSMCVGPATLRSLLHLHTTTGQYISDSQYSPTPHTRYSPSPYQSIPNNESQYNSEYYGNSDLELDTENVKLRDTQRGTRKSVDTSVMNQESDNQCEYIIHTEFDKLNNDWKTSWKGVLFIGFIWSASFHNLYSFCCLSINLINTFDILIFDIGLIYCFTFFGISIGIFISSIILNQPSYFKSSQIIVTYSIFIVFLTQLIVSIVFYYINYYEYHTISMLCWYILLSSKFLLGLSIGFIETSIDNLLFEWFLIVDEIYFISKARPYTLLLKELGNCSARLLLVPLVYITFSNDTNLFFALLFGLILSALSCLSMIYAAIKDSNQISHTGNTCINNNNTIEGNEENEKTPLLTQKYVHTLTKNEWIMKDMTCDILSYKKWSTMKYDGFNICVFLCIIYLSLNFAISFSFIILSITIFVQQYGYTDYTANLLLCLIPFINVTCNGFIRHYLLSPLKSEFMVAFIGTISFSIIFSLLSWLHIDGSNIWLPIICILLFVFGYECFTACGYEILLTSTKPEIHALISSINSTANYLLSAIFIIVFSILVDVSEHDENLNITFKYQWAYLFLACASYFNIVIIVLLKLYYSNSTDLP